MKTLFLKLPVELDLQLTLKARRDRLTKSEVVRKALEAYLPLKNCCMIGAVLVFADHTCCFRVIL
jgi:hypothetical protein